MGSLTHMFSTLKTEQCCARVWLCVISFVTRLRHNTYTKNLTFNVWFTCKNRRVISKIY